MAQQHTGASPPGPILLFGPGSGRAFDIATDGRRFLMIEDVGSSAGSAPRLILVQSWHEELKRLVPTN